MFTSAALTRSSYSLVRCIRYSNDCIPTTCAQEPSPLAKITMKRTERQFSLMTRQGSTNVLLQPLGQLAYVRGCADKSLARPTSRCRSTESIVSLEKRGLFMCRIASLFFLQKLKGSMSGDARDFNNIETRAVISFFSPCRAKRQRKFTPF